MEVNIVAVLVGAVVSMIVGGIWFGPLFGKKWMEVLGVDPNDPECTKEMQKAALPLYGIQFLLALLQVYILAHFVKGWSEVSGVEAALWIWLGFVLPTLAGSCMWTNETTRQKWMRFGIQIGYQLVIFVLFGYILSRLG